MKSRKLGATFLKNGKVFFDVWAPRCRELSVLLTRHNGRSEKITAVKDRRGHFTAEARGVGAGDTYFYLMPDGSKRPDPCSFYQPRGVHGPSAIIDTESFRWTDKHWKGIRLEDTIFYELHVGTFMPQGTFRAAIAKIPYLKKLGVTCIEIMPVAQTPGKRNWGYDGVDLFAVQASYGGPDGFKAFVDAAHAHGLAVCLDVVYNHLGPEGNYLREFGPYFTDKHHTPWGAAINYDDAGSRGVRDFIIANALHWIREYHVDVLRLDAIHSICDDSPVHILRELNDHAQALGKKLGRRVLVVAESDLNDSIIIRPKAKGGYGLAAQWSDDFHHAVHAYLTGERSGYYRDFGKIEDIAKALRDGFVYDGIYSDFRGRVHGNSVRDLPKQQMVICIQNHDQVGNRAFGERLSELAPPAKEKIGAALLLFPPATPLIFMGQEYGERAPFQYFVDHGDPGLVHAVREGRKREFASFGWTHIPDPQSNATFLRSKLAWKRLKKNPHRGLFRLYADLIRIRKQYLGADTGKNLVRVLFSEKSKWLALERKSGRKSYWLVVSFSKKPGAIQLPIAKRKSEIFLDTNDSIYGGNSGASNKMNSSLSRGSFTNVLVGDLTKDSRLKHSGMTVIHLQPMSAVLIRTAPGR